MQSQAALPISKSEFARRRNVSPGRVTQWISEKKIQGDALVGEGRSATIIEAIAVEQLRRSIDPVQRFGNGLATDLNLEIPVQEPPAPLPTTEPAAAAPRVTPAADPVDEQIRRARLEELTRRNRRLAEEEEARAGRLTDTDEAAAAMTKLAARMVSTFEGSLPEFASVIAAKYQLPERDVLHLLRAEFLKYRAGKSAEAAKEAEALPASLEHHIESALEDESEPAGEG